MNCKNSDNQCVCGRKEGSNNPCYFLKPSKVIEIKNPHGIRITKSDTDGIFIHFQGSDKERAYGVELNDFLDKFDIGRDVIKDWVDNCVTVAEFARNDKINNNGHYEPGNIRFVTCKENNNNRGY